MTLRLAELETCFEGVVPAIIATLSADGVPNISYLSHIVRVDDRHIALSNQFFGKTASNLRAVPKATILLVDGRSGTQVRAEALYIRSETTGQTFDRVAAQLAATSAQVGMAEVMVLRSVDVFLVTALSRVASDSQMMAPVPAPVPAPVTLSQAAQALSKITEAETLGDVVEAVLTAVIATTASDAASLLLCDPTRSALSIIGSRGYDRSGIGAEIAIGEGVAGLAMQERRAVRVGDLSRVRRFGAAIQNTAEEENRTRNIPLPGLSGALSQLAVPIVAQGQAIGVILAESLHRLAYLGEDEAALTLIAGAAGPSVALANWAPAKAEPEEMPPVIHRPPGPAIPLTHYAQDDSVFIDGAYIIKGVAGRLLLYLAEIHHSTGRVDFTDREVRLAEDLRLPGYRDNLETRLLLLQRRLDERAAPIRIARPGRGRIRLETTGALLIRRV